MAVLSGKPQLISRYGRVARMEQLVRPISYKRHRFPADAIRHAVWLYYRFTLSFRDVEELRCQARDRSEL